MTMKLFVTALALISGTAFAQAPTAPAKAAADTPQASMTTTTETTTKVEKKTETKKMAAKTKAQKTMSAKKTQSMGAPAAMIQTDLNAPARQTRMDQAYSNWQAGSR
ncbi:MAG TPA: hypothetical protein VLK85_03435 [Ramlibacter sp.]|nr:hypothetical protein [Ramlibacter sp.]